MGIRLGSVVISAGNTPPTVSVSASEPPLYGIGVKGTLLAFASMTPRKCMTVPAPGVP
ncbi:hypothetical protein D3C87_1479580 [compost metagenome]